MPASLPGSTAADNKAGNPNAGKFVIFDPLSGPKGSPLDKDAAGNASTGGLSTGIAMTTQPVIAAGGIKAAGFTDDRIPGTKLDNAVDSTWLYIGGGRSLAGGAPNPYVAGVAIVGAGNGASRDGGLGPAVFTGFSLKMVTAVGAVDNGAAIEAGWENRSGVALVAGQSCHGVAAAELAAPA